MRSQCGRDVRLGSNFVKLRMNQSCRGLATAVPSETASISPRKDEKKAKIFEQRTLSGIQPTGVPHLGNYVGALANWVRLQEGGDKGSSPGKAGNVLYSIVDLHALTVPQDPAKLRKNVVDMAASLLACGLDMDKSILFRQSKVPQHSELAWLLFCQTPIGWLSRMHQWKSKLQALQRSNGSLSGTSAAATIALASEKLDDDPTMQGLNVGLLAYPVLQAADILIYRATNVPIGEDQVQHLELTAMVARSINSRYEKEIFPIPRGYFASSESKRIMSLRNPVVKMSKSDPSEASRINIDDTPDQIRSKIRKATVDSDKGITYDPLTRPGVANLINIQSALTERGADQIAAEYASLGNKEFKDRVAEVIIAHLDPIRTRLSDLRAEKGFVESLLVKGEDQAREIAGRTLRDVQKAMGLR
ncbi:hypothetical protein DFS34DRAFT_361475 [Phlyctochytrium arcticum]|nr:hypothetical protein DFS34DRAFT_361475 [Phlyctochytrium arcticum]